jgi:hypothetical protein
MAENEANYRWMPTAGGVLSIVAGALGLLISLVMIIVGIVTAMAVQAAASGWGGFPAIVFGFIALWFLALGVLAVMGGVFSLKHHNWALALTGSIAAFFCGGHILAIMAIVFIAISRKEFTS